MGSAVRGGETLLAGFLPALAVVGLAVVGLAMVGLAVVGSLTRLHCG